MPDPLHIPIDPMVVGARDLAVRTHRSTPSVGAILSVDRSLRALPPSPATPTAGPSEAPADEDGGDAGRAPHVAVWPAAAGERADHATPSPAAARVDRPSNPNDPPASPAPAPAPPTSQMQTVTKITNIGVQYTRTPADRADNNLSRTGQR